MPALSWLHGSARLRRYGTQVAECDNSDEGGSVSNGGDGRSVGVGRGWRSGGRGRWEAGARGKNPIGGDEWRAPGASSGGADEMAETRACGKRARPGPQGANPVRPDRRARAAAAERPGGAGNIFALCVISGRSTRKGGLGGKIRAPCILNCPIALGNGYVRRGSCHSDLEKHTFRANIARKRVYFAHSAKREYIWCDSCQLGTRAPQCEGGCRVL